MKKKLSLMDCLGPSDLRDRFYTTQNKILKSANSKTNKNQIIDKTSVKKRKITTISIFVVIILAIIVGVLNYEVPEIALFAVPFSLGVILPIVFTMDGLSEELLAKILKEPRNAILKQYEKLLEIDEVKLEFTDDAILAIAKKALDKNTGARALRSILEEYMLDIMYEIPKDDNIGKVTITKEYIEKTGGPVIEMRSN